MNYILIKTKKGCIPIRQKFEKLKEAKSELFRIATYEGGCWFDNDGFECKIIKK